jgi:hypothetical protein
MADSAASPPPKPCINVASLEALVNMAKSGGPTIADAVRSCPSAAHPAWCAEELDHLNSLPRVGTLHLNMAGTRLQTNTYALPGPGCPFNTTMYDSNVQKPVVKSVPIVRVI